MQLNPTRIAARQRGFTLVELITAMAITSILVFVIMSLTNQGIGLWKMIREDTSSSASARLALQTIAQDLESFQVRPAAKNYQWMYAEIDKSMSGVPHGLSIPRSARCIFFSCPADRNPAVSSNSSLRSSYRTTRAGSPDGQGDVSAISYRLHFRDHILNLPGRNGDTSIFPLFSLYRQVVSPRDTYDYMLGRDDLRAAYAQFERDEDKNFLCENIVELSLILNIEYASENSSGGADIPRFEVVSVPLLSSSASHSGAQKFQLFGNRAEVQGLRMDNAHIVSAQVSLTVLTEEGVALVEQVRLGQRRAPKLEEFFSKYTRSYARSVNLPIPL